MSAKRNALSAVGWLALHALRLLLRALAFLGSRWAKKRLREQTSDRSRTARLTHPFDRKAS